MKKPKLILVIIMMFVILCLSIFSMIVMLNKKIYSSHNYRMILPKVPKVILMIGDGMGENHIKIGETYLERTMTFEGFEHQGYVSTASNSLIGPTDSAAAATAMATGIKVTNGHVSMNNGKDLATISEYAKNSNLGVGIVTTDSLYGATPAGFSAHAKNRKAVDDIIKSQMKSNVDLFLGAGYNRYKDYQFDFEQNQYLFCHQYDQLDLNAKKICASFSKVVNYNHTNENPTLVKLVEFAVSYMEQNFPNGYFLMIEGAHIDKMSHKKKIIDMIQYLDGFDQAVSYLYQKFNNHDDVALLVTADHETGNLPSFKGNKNDIKDNLYRSGSHSRQDVKYFLHFGGENASKYSLPDKIDNTDIFRICYQFLIREGEINLSNN